MGIKTFLGFSTKSESGTVPPTNPLPEMTTYQVARLMDKIQGMSYERLWQTQPHVRAVADFMAREIAHLGLHVFERTSDNDRQRNHDSNTAKALARPNLGMTSYDLKESLVRDKALYRDSWWMTAETREGWTIRPLPVAAVSIASGSAMNGDLKIRYSGSRGSQLIEQRSLIRFASTTPAYDGEASSVLDSLRATLSEQIAAEAFRKSMWANGGQMGSYIQRPKDAAEWAPGARARFIEGLRQFRLGGAKAGGTLLLEEGMTIQQNRFNAKEEQWLEAAQLSLETVARAFHINPSMLGSTSGVTYANMREFRTMLYTETLGPEMAQIQDVINTFLIPRLDPGRELYVEFNIAQKLAGSFEEQAAVLSSSTGAPWMTRNEARAKNNLPRIEGADALVVPLNVLEGGQASPRDVSPKAAAVNFKANKPKELTAGADGASIKNAERTIDRFFERQSASVLAKLNAKKPDYWDSDRWNKELSDDLYGIAMAVTTQVSTDALSSIGQESDAYDTGRTEKFLRSVSDSRARWVNSATVEALDEAINDPREDEDGNPVLTPAAVFETARTTRGEQISKTLTTAFVAFALVEVGTQLAGSKATKTWFANSGNSRSEHAAMDGETVTVGTEFSNGAQWPGDPVLGAEGVANCQCSVQINIP
jgi:phage portal protein BeeE